MSCGHTPAIRCDGGGGPAGGGDLCLPPPEHSCTVYYDQAHYGLVSGGEADTGDTGIQAALGSGRDGCGGDANGGLGGRTERGAGGDGRDDDGDGQLIRWEYTVANVILGTEPNAPRDYAPGLELHHPVMSILWGNLGRLEKERELKMQNHYYQESK